MVKQITSLANPLIKQIIALDTAGERRQTGIFAVEGLREIALALKAHYRIQTLLYCPQYTDALHLQNSIPYTGDTELIEVSAAVFEKIAYRKHVANAIALCETRPLLLESLILSANPLLIALETVEKPGNLGAILRTADAAGIDGLLLCNPQTDVFNPNVIRSSLGAVFTCPPAVCPSPEPFAYLPPLQLPIIAAALTPAAIPYHQIRFDQPCAIAFGSEAYGLSDEWLEQSDLQAIIPMWGEVNSLNVSVSAAILIYEALRQRIDDFRR